MRYTHLGISYAHAARIRSHHELIITLLIPATLINKNFAAQLQRFFAITFTELIEIGSLQTFDTMDIAVHASVEALVDWCIGGQFRVKNNLVKRSKV